jgi:hypothetical protein
MLVKCICTNCAGHLEFEEENAGETIACPHCGFETVLTLPGTETLAPELLALSRRRALRRRLAPLLVAFFILAGFGYVLYRWGVPWIEDVLPSIDSTGKAIVVLLLGCALAPFALFWLVFPILLFFQIRKGTELLSRIAESLESMPREPATAAEDLSPNEEEAETQEEGTTSE